MRTPWRAVASMFVLNGALFGIWASRIPAMATIHDLGKAELGLLLLLLATGAILAFPIAGASVDRMGAARVTRAIAVIYGLAIILMGLAPTTLVLATALLLFGASHGAMDVAMNAWGAEVERALDRTIMSSLHAMFSLGAGLGAATGWYAAGADLSPFVHFSVAGLVLTVLCLLMAMIAWESPKQSQPSSAPVFALPKGALMFVGLAAFCASLGEGAMADWSALFLVIVNGVSESEAALGYLVFSITMVIMRLMGDRIILRFGPTHSAKLAGASALAGVLIAVFSGHEWGSLLGFALMGAGYAVIMPLAFSRAANDAVQRPGAAIAAVSTLGYGGMLLGPPIIGFLAEWITLKWAFLLLAILAIGTIVLSRDLQTRHETS